MAFSFVLTDNFDALHLRLSFGDGPGLIDRECLQFRNRFQVRAAFYEHTPFRQGG